MPWEVAPVSRIRLAFVHAVRHGGVPVVHAARRFGVSRKTAFKWLARFDAATSAATSAAASAAASTAAADVAALEDRSRRPHRSPSRTQPDVERDILDARDRFGWGGRKLRAYLLGQGRIDLPSARTTHAVLARHARVTEAPPASLDVVPVQHFEHPAPHDLWQADHKGPVEVGRRDRFPLAVEDDHSRFLIVLHACPDKTMAHVWDVLWEAFGEFGMPRAILSDNAFGTNFEVPKTPSWLDARLIRLGIRPVHGRPYHPQTQGKVERLNGTLQRELFGRGLARSDRDEHFDADLAAFRDLYNHIRPHEALGDRTPASRFAKSPRPRPDGLPDPESFYPAASVLRKVSTSGDVRYAGARILAGRGLVGQTVRVEPDDRGGCALFYCWKRIRTVPVERMSHNGML